MPALGFALVPEERVARLSLAPRAVRCGVPQGVQFVGEWGAPRAVRCGVPQGVHDVREWGGFGGGAWGWRAPVRRALPR